MKRLGGSRGVLCIGRWTGTDFLTSRRYLWLLTENFVEPIRRRKEERNPKVLQDRKGVTNEIFERRTRGAIKWGRGRWKL